MERAPGPFGEKIFPPAHPWCLRATSTAGTVSHRIREIPQGAGSMREHLAPQARTLGRDHAAPNAMLAMSQYRGESARHWLRTGQSLQMAIAAAASCRTCCSPGVTGNHTSASRLLAEHRACRMTRAHVRLLTRAGADTPSGNTATWAGACVVAREWFGWAAGKACHLSAPFTLLQDFALTGGHHCR